MSKLYQDAEAYIKEIFWNETNDKSNTLKLEDVINAKLVKDNKEKDPDYYNHRPGVVHVSSLSGCLRGVVYEMLGAERTTPIDPHKLGIFRAGNLFEDFIVDALGDKMLDRQTEYIFRYQDIILTGRDDGTFIHEGKRMMLEAKSVHSDSFWYREKEGTLVASHNQMQIQTYLWLRRECPNVFMVNQNIVYTNLSEEELSEFKCGTLVSRIEKPDNSELGGIFSYISKDDCTVIGAPVRFNPNIIKETIIPALDYIVEGYRAKNPDLVPAPSLVVYAPAKGQFQKNWLATYCEFHEHCAGAGWVLEAQSLVTQKNRELKAQMGFEHTIKKVKPNIQVVGTVEPVSENIKS